MDDHTPDQQTVNHNLQWMAETTLKHQDGPQKKRKLEELLENHYGFAFMNFFLIALARHSSAANVGFLIRAQSQFGNTAFRQSPDYVIHFIQSQGMRPTVTKVMTGLQNIMQRMKRKHDLSESDFQVAFVESFEKCRTLVHPDDKQISTAQSPHWNNQDHKVTEGTQMDSAVPVPQWDNQDRGITGGSQMNSAVPAPQWDNQDRGITGGSQMNPAVPAPQWDNQDRGITGGSQMNSAVPAPQWDNQDRGITGGSQMNPAVPVPQWYNQDRGITGGSQMNSAVPAPQWDYQDHGIIGGFQMSPGVPNLLFSMKDIQETSLDYAEDDSSQVAGGSQPRA
ncbi:hypothetical protein LA080_006041 [Diaporthe eres]|nr:hypothetical protein LA080_006041 [Diaporthe eres]